MAKTREWTVECKRCGKVFGYSDRSYRESLQYGFSRPEYCEKCQPEEAQSRVGLGAPYFHVPFIEGALLPGPLGMIFREERHHEAKDIDRGFDETKFGLTQDKIREIARWFEDPDHRVAVVVGPTGSGKSTALPFWLVYPPEGIEEDFFTKDGQILVTQPRIVAVTGISKYLGLELMGSSVGAGYDVGYRYSKEDKADWRNAIELTTDGKFINALVAGKIAQYGIIIIDEAHERSENIETILRLLKDRMGLYPNLKVIIASATIDAKFFAQYFEREGAKVIEFESRQRLDEKGRSIEPPKPQFAEDDEALPYENVALLVQPLLKVARKKVQWIVQEIIEKKKDWGDVLVFLHGKMAIDDLAQALKDWAVGDEKLSKVLEVYPLYRELDDDLKDRALAQSKSGKIKIVISTNIAEASVTVDGVVYEVETGVEYQPRFNKDTHSTDLPLVRISKANAKQRWGRVGRTQRGEVFCLYTQTQFENDELFPKYPLPAMQRVSMEGVVLTAKAAGIPNVTEGWLGDPPKEEIERSTSELVSAGALTEDFSLTSYGMLLRRFSYPPKLIDLLLAAEDAGCSVEMATILAVIRNGGNKRILRWRFGWDAYTKLLAARRHGALIGRCKDDVEFILKIYKSWSELSHLDQTKIGGYSDEQMDELRLQWSALHYVDHSVLRHIREERDEVLDVLRVHMKVDRPPQINFRLIPRVRSILVTMLGEQECLSAEFPYQYGYPAKPEKDTIAYCKVLRKDLVSYDPARWFEMSFESVKDYGQMRSRLLVEQVYPVGQRYLAEVELVEGEEATVKISERILSTVDLQEDQQIHEVAESDGAEIDTEEESILSEDRESAPAVKISNIPIRYSEIDCMVMTSLTGLSQGMQIEIEVERFNVFGQYDLVVWTKVIQKPEPFDSFIKRYRYGDTVNVAVADVVEYPGDHYPFLVVIEEKTGMEILLESHELSFTRHPYVVKQVPLGTPLQLNVEGVDQIRRRVRLSNWETVEKLIAPHLLDHRDDGASVTSAKVIEVRANGTVFFSLGWGKSEQGAGVVASAQGKVLSKKLEEYKLGEVETVQVRWKDRREAYTELAKIPAKVKSQIPREAKDGDLSWKQGVLRFTGKLDYKTLYNLKASAEDDVFHRALEKLYWYANRIQVARLLDSNWQRAASERYSVGETADGVVTEVNEFGVKVELAGGILGFAPRSRIFNGNADPRKLFSVGGAVKVEVKELRYGKQELLLGISSGEMNPLLSINVGDLFSGEVVRVMNYGIFVNIAPGVDGLVHRSQMYKKRRWDIQEIFRVGDTVRCKVVELDKEQGRAKLTMLLPENDPLQNLKEGHVLRGTITTIMDFGAFVFLESDADIDGLLKTADYPVSQEARENIKIGARLFVRVNYLDYERRKIGLEYVRRISTD